MRQYILVALAALALTACSSNDEGSFAPSWGDLTMTQTKGAITDYTEVVYQHSKEPIANYSFKAVQLCQIKEIGMTEEDLIDLIQADYNQAKKCWNALRLLVCCWHLFSRDTLHKPALQANHAA